MNITRNMIKRCGHASLVSCVASLSFFAACSTTSQGDNTGTGGAQGIASSGGSPNSGGAAAEGCPALPNLGVRFVGRVDGCDPKGARMSWSGTGFVGRFRGTGIIVEINDSPNQYTVVLDGKVMPTLKTAKGQQTYSLASDLANGEHSVEFYRRTEASQGTTIITDIQAVGDDAGVGVLLPPSEPSSRHIEVLGDSITCGYGADGTFPCSFTADTENNYLAYGSILARDLNADINTVAWSGKGVYSNYGGSRVEPLPALYDLTIPTDYKHPWPFTWQPDLVIINLGTNDYSGDTDPSDAKFTTAYQSLLEQVRTKNPDAIILCTIGPMLTGADLEAVRRNVGAAILARTTAGDSKVEYYELKTANEAPYGCDYHPNLATQAAVAAELEAEIHTLLGW